MVKLSNQISNLVIVLIALKVIYNQVEAGKITSLSQPNERLNLKENSLNTNSEEILSKNGSEEVSELSSSALESNPDDSRSSTVYSYFYIGRWAWHIPLWFLLWFVFYVAFNVVRAIQGHSVRITMIDC